MAVGQDITDNINAREKKNETLIKRYEKYGAEYYDSFLPLIARNLSSRKAAESHPSSAHG